MQHVAVNCRRLFDAQGKRLGALRAATAADRIATLRRLRDAVQGHFAELTASLNDDLGKPPFEAAIDIAAIFSEIAEIEEGLAGWMEPEVVPLGPAAHPAAKGYVVRQPRGRVLIFGPWNLPFGLLMQPLAAAVAAGNSAILKPSEYAPATAAVVRRIVAEVFAEDEVAVVEGGPDVAQALLDLPFDHVFFTGSTPVGKQVMAAAARHLASVTLELGGKCPVIVDEGVDLARVARSVVSGKVFNAGQVCLAPDHVWLSRGQLEEFVALLAANYDSAFRADGTFARHDSAKIVNARHFDRLAAHLEDAKSRGARVVYGGAMDRDALFFEPTVLVDVDPASTIMAEEIFGPLLPVLVYEDLGSLLQSLRDAPKPLALYAFSDRAEVAERIIAETSSGGVTINDLLLHASSMALPFGGVGESGMGSYHGRHSFLELTHARAIVEMPSTVPPLLPVPPFGDRMPF